MAKNSKTIPELAKIKNKNKVRRNKNQEISNQPTAGNRAARNRILTMTLPETVTKLRPTLRTDRRPNQVHQVMDKPHKKTQTRTMVGRLEHIFLPGTGKKMDPMARRTIQVPRVARKLMEKTMQTMVQAVTKNSKNNSAYLMGKF